MRFGRRPLRNRSQVHRCVFVVINFSFYIPGIRVQVGERTEDFQQIIDFQSFEIDLTRQPTNKDRSCTTEPGNVTNWSEESPLRVTTQNVLTS